MSKVAVAIQNLTKTFFAGRVLRALQKNPPREAGTEVLKGISLGFHLGVRWARITGTLSHF